MTDREWGLPVLECVWTPNLSSTAGLEVMVFIHGGGTETDKGQLYGAGLLSGSGHEGGNDWSSLKKQPNPQSKTLVENI